MIHPPNGLERMIARMVVVAGRHMFGAGIIHLPSPMGCVAGTPIGLINRVRKYSMKGRVGVNQISLPTQPQ
jgi:hypothetical protein